MPLLEGRQQIAIKQEGTAGSAETLAAADVVFHSGVASWEAKVEPIAREFMSASLSPRGSVIGNRPATIKWKMPLSCSYNHTTGAIAAPVAASTEPQFSVPLKGCGALLTVSGAGPNEQCAFTPSSTTISDETTGAYCTVALYQDGKQYKIHGAVGNCVLTFNTGSPAMAEFTFTGLYNTPTDVSLLSGAIYPTTVEPAFLGASVSLIGSMTTAKLQSLSLDLGNAIAMRPYPNGTTGFFTAQITGRKPVGSFDPEEALVSVKDWFAEWVAGTAGAITTGTYPSGGTNYNQFNLNIPNAMYTKVGLAGRDGIATAPHDFECMANTVAGDDEWTLIQT